MTEEPEEVREIVDRVTRKNYENSRRLEKNQRQSVKYCVNIQIEDIEILVSLDM